MLRGKVLSIAFQTSDLTGYPVLLFAEACNPPGHQSLYLYS